MQTKKALPPKGNGIKLSGLPPIIAVACEPLRRTEASAHLAVYHGLARCPLTGVVVRRHVRTIQEGEERLAVLAVALLQSSALPPVAREAWTNNDFPYDKRVHFIPEVKLIITIPPTNNRLFVHRFDVDGAGDVPHVHD